jgi:hypothetical protein
VLFLDHPIHHHKLSVLAEVFTPSPDLRFDCKSKIDHVAGQSLIGRCVPACATVVLLSDKHVAVCVLSALYGLIFRVRDACETDLKHYSPIAVYHIFSFPPAQCTIPVYTQLTAHLPQGETLAKTTAAEPQINSSLKMPDQCPSHHTHELPTLA